MDAPAVQKQYAAGFIAYWTRGFILVLDNLEKRINSTSAPAAVNLIGYSDPNGEHPANFRVAGDLAAMRPTVASRAVR